MIATRLFAFLPCQKRTILKCLLPFGTPSQQCLFKKLATHRTYISSTHMTVWQPRRLPSRSALLLVKCKLTKNSKSGVLLIRNCSSLSSSKLSRSRIIRIVQIAKPERWKLSAAIILLFLSSVVTLSVPFFIGKVIDVMYSTPATEVKQKLTTICQFLVIFFIAGGLANFGRVYFINIAGQNIVNRLRTTLFGSILKQEIGFFDASKTGELVNRLASDTTVVGYSITQNISDGLRAGIAVLTGVGMMIYISPSLSLVGLIVVPPIAALAIIYGRYLRKISQSLQDSLANATQTAEENILNIRTVRSFAKENYVHKQYVEKIATVLHLAKKESIARGIFFGSTGLSGNLVVLLVLYYGGVMMAVQKITIGDLSSFLMYAAYVGMSIGGLTSFYTELMRGLGASERLWNLMDREPAIPLTCGFVPSSIKGDIDFSDVTFSFPSRPDVKILKHFSLSIPSGCVQAIVGTSGSGKSTLASLLLRFYDTNSGSVLVDGKNIKDLNLNWLRSQIGIVSQEPILFSCSIRDNVIFGTADSSSEEKIIESLKKANAWDFIQQFPNGLDTVVGERGTLLSGGQKQRIAIARAIIKDPKILLLDEATSALDAESEYLVQEALECVMRNRTVIVIAHRLSTIASADRIAVLNKGQIVESGTFQELVELKNGLFQKLVERQTGSVGI